MPFVGRSIGFAWALDFALALGFQPLRVTWAWLPLQRLRISLRKLGASGSADVWIVHSFVAFL